MKVEIIYKGKVVASDIVLANNFSSRLMGYMFRKTPHCPGLLFEPCNAIHTCFMRFPLDLVFLSKDNEVIKVIRSILPWRHTWFYFKARRTLEVPAGMIPSELKEGDMLEVKYV